MTICMPLWKTLSSREGFLLHYLKRKLSFFLLFFFFSSFSLFAQTISVTGKVTSRDSALAGATVQVKGTNATTLTDEDGNFTISAPSGGTLVFSSVGYVNQEVKINNRTQIPVQLEPSVSNMNEVIVVGYGTQRKGTVTGSVSTVKSSDLVRTPATTTSGALVGRTQGVTARAQDSRPGGSVNIQIRNMGAPLFVIDGVPSDAGQFNNLGLEDIESISVLKDASAAIYGLRAANGVILVTTKKGKTGGKTDINVSGYYGLQNFTNFPKPPDAATYLRGLAWSNQNRGFTNPVTLTPEEIAKWEKGTEKGYQSVDYYKLIMRPNVPQKYINASASGGSATSKYYLSVSHTDQDALIKDFLFQRTNMQANLEAGLAKGLKVGTQISGRFEKRRQAGVPGLDDYFNPMLSIFTMWPTETPYANNNPRYVNGAVHNINVNPATYNMDVTGYSRDDWQAIKPIFNVQYDLPFGLTVKGTYSYNYTTQMLEEFEYTYDAYEYNATNDTYKVVGGNQNPWRRKRSQHIQENFAQLQANYSKQIGDHSISAVAAYERSDVKAEWLETGSLPQNNTVAIVYFQDQNRLDQRYSEQARAGYIARVNYNYRQKYLVEALGRYDGSFLYAKDRRFGLFPGISLGWRISQEPFMDNKIGNIFNDLKLRASYGETGSEIGFPNGAAPVPFGYLQGYDYAQGAGSAVFNGTLVTGVRPRGLPITSLSWVTNISRNVGVDFAILKNRLSGTFDVFERKRTGLPAPRYDVILPAEAGYSFPNENLESDAIRGMEGVLTYSKNSQNGINYTISANGTFARMKILERYKPRFGNSWDEYRFSTVNRWANVNFGHQVVGRFKNQAEIDNHPINNDRQGNRTQLPGDLIYKDVNGDKIINDLDMRPIGYAQGATPYVSFGLNSTVEFRGFNLAVDFAGATMQTFERQFELQIPFQNNGAGVGYLISDAWRRADPFDANSPWIAGTYPAVRKDFPGHANYSRRNDFWITNVKYIRLRNLQLGYSLPKNIIDRFGMRGLRFYVQGTNLFSIDNVKDYQIDPEISSVNGLVYPQQRLYTFGFNLNL